MIARIAQRNLWGHFSYLSASCADFRLKQRLFYNSGSIIKNIQNYPLITHKLIADLFLDLNRIEKRNQR